MTGALSPHAAALMQAVASALQRGDEAGAENALRQLVAENPRQAEAWHMLAGLVIRAGRGAEAIECALRAHELDRRSPLYLNTLGIAYGEAQQLDEAVRCFKRSLKELPSRADTHYNLGKTYSKLGDMKEAQRCYVRAHQLDPERGEIANNLAELYSRQGRYREALALIAEARVRTPENEVLAINSAMAALATSGPEAAIQELEDFLRRMPDSVVVHEELAARLLAQGRFAEGWREYAWRRTRPPAERVTDLRGRRVLLLWEQGLGDQLFFLRFAAALRERATHVAFDCPAKLFSLLKGNEIVNAVPSGEALRQDFDVALPVGDLPQALEDSTTPAPLRLAARRAAEWRERLAALGPAPYLGVTWRAGTEPGHKAEFAAGADFLYKEIAVASLAAAVREWRGTVLVLQRMPRRAEVETFSKALGRRAHDLSALNEDLEDIAAVLSLIDEYIGVSNTNMHIRAGLGKTARVLVPFPPEFRWMHAGGESPWFPGLHIYRQTAGRDWRSVLDLLREDLNR